MNELIKSRYPFELTCAEKIAGVVHVPVTAIFGVMVVFKVGSQYGPYPVPVAGGNVVASVYPVMTPLKIVAVAVARTPPLGGAAMFILAVSAVYPDPPLVIGMLATPTAVSVKAIS